MAGPVVDFPTTAGAYMSCSPIMIAGAAETDKYRVFKASPDDASFRTPATTDSTDLLSKRKGAGSATALNGLRASPALRSRSASFRQSKHLVLSIKVSGELSLLM